MTEHHQRPAAGRLGRLSRTPVVLALALFVFSLQFLFPWSELSVARFLRSIGIGTVVIVLWWLWIGRPRTLDHLLPAEKDHLRDVRRVKDFVLAFTAGAAAILIVFSLHHGSQLQSMLGLLGLSGLVAVASLITGATMGLLFGIPRANRERESPETKAGDSTTNGSSTTDSAHTESATASSKGPAQPLFRSNTNLEEISDWLTKIIVGLGLAHLAQMPGYVKRLTTFVSGSGAVPGSAAFTPNVALAVMVAFGGCGFFLGYLMTRLFLLGALVRAEDPFQVQLSRLVEETDSAPGSTATVQAQMSGEVAARERSPLTESEVARAIRAEKISKRLPIGTVAAELRRLAGDYELLYLAKPPGVERTDRMERVVTQMRRLALAAEPLLQQLMHSPSAGERLAAITALTLRPKPEAIQWLADRIEADSPFIGYHAAVALRLAIRALPQYKAELEEAILRGIKVVEHKRDSDRLEELQRALQELRAPPE